MSPLAIAVVSSLAWFTVFIVTHLIWAQVARDSRYSRVIVRCLALSLLGSTLTIAFSHNTLWFGAPLSWLVAEGAAIFLMCCAFVLYMPFVFVVATSLSVDTLLILHRERGRMPRAEIYSRFVSPRPVRHRLDTMRGNGLLAVRGGRYHLTRKAVLLARFFTAMKRLWNLWPGG